MLLINCGRRGSPFQTPKIPREELYKKHPLYRQPHHLAQPRLGLWGERIKPSSALRVTASQAATSGGCAQVAASGGCALRACWGDKASGTQRGVRPAAGVLRGDLRFFVTTATVLVSHFTGKEVHQHRFSSGVVVETQTAGTDLRTPGRREQPGTYKLPRVNQRPVEICWTTQGAL